MIIKKASLDNVIGISSQIPRHNIPEVAFIGRSNVGKSSLINTLLGRKSFARTSGKPGKTQTINFYNVNNSIYLADLPGYGYANAPKSETKKWGDMVARYFNESKMLRAIFLLCDLRHEATKLDLSMFEWIHYLEYQPIIIATKADKIKPSKVDSNIKLLKNSLNTKEAIVVPFSSVTGQGRDTILDFLDQIIENE